MIDNSERNYYDLATDQSKVIQNYVDICRNWKNNCKDNSPKDILTNFVDIMVSVDRDPYLNKSGGVNYLRDLIKEIFAYVIENSKITVFDLNSMFNLNRYSIGPELSMEKTKQLEMFARMVVDTKRMKKNHEIISKRYNIKELINKLFFRTNRRNLGCFTPFIFSMCRKLDTYNLELPDKINLMCEEIAYIIDSEYKHVANWDDEDNRYNTLKNIIPGVFTYILGTYTSDGIPTDVVDKVLKAAANKLYNSSFFISNGLLNYGNVYLDTILKDSPNNNNVKQIFINAQKSGSINTESGMKDLFKELNKNMAGYDMKFICFYIIYFYAIFTDKFEKFNLSVSKALYNIITNHVNKDYNDIALSEKIFRLEDFISQIHTFSICLKPIAIYTDSTDKAFVDRYTKVVIEIDKLLQTLYSDLYYLKLKKNSMNDKIVEDRNDDTAFSHPGNPSMYEIKNKVTFDFIKDKVNHLSKNEAKDFVDIITDPSIIINQEATDYIDKVLDVLPDYFNMPQLKSRLQESYKSISENYNITGDNVQTINAMGNISNLIRKIDKIENTPEVLKEDTTIIPDYTMDNIHDTIDEIVSNNINAFIVAETTKEVLKLDPVHEMKIINYARLALDKVKEGWNKLTDTQKEICNTIDRMAETFDHYNEKEAKAEARLQVVKGNMLPSASSCLKTILQAGALFVINPWFGLILMIVKFVTAKNATKEERQAVIDELEVEIEMIDRRIQDAVDDKEYDKERKLRILKKKMLTQYSKMSMNNDLRWNKSLVMKDKTDETGSRITLKD